MNFNDVGIDFQITLAGKGPLDRISMDHQSRIFSDTKYNSFHSRINNKKFKIGDIYLDQNHRIWSKNSIFDFVN